MPRAASICLPSLKASGTQMGLHFITRERIHVDRTGTAWTILRFIDPDATFEFVPRTRDIRKFAGIPIDVRGAELSHRDGRCTFESLLDKYELRDPALRRMAAIIRGADLPLEEDRPPESRNGSTQIPKDVSSLTSPCGTPRSSSVRIASLRAARLSTPKLR